MSDPISRLFSKIDSTLQVCWAEIAANLTGSSDDVVRELGDLNELAIKVLSKEDPTNRPEICHLLKISLRINDEGLTSKERIEKALELWKMAAQFQVEQRSRTAEKTFLSRSVFLPSTRDRIDSIPEFLVEYVADLDLSEVKDFDHWLKVLMPTRAKRADRQARFRRYILSETTFDKVEPIKPINPFSEQIEPIEQSAHSERRLDEIKRHFTGSDAAARRSAALANTLKQETLGFMAWDRSQSEIDRRAKAKKAASAKWEKK